MKKKILFVTKALWIGGIETALTNLLRQLDPEKYEITCLLLQDVQTMAHRLPQTCRLLVADREHTVSFPSPYRFARLFHLAEEPQNPSRLHRLLIFLTPAVRWAENRLYIRYVRRAMAGERFDTCVIYSDVAAETAVRAIRAEKFLLFYHHGAMRRVYHDEIGYRRSEAIIAVSRNVENALRKYRSAHAAKMTTVHNFTDVEAIREKSREQTPEAFEEDVFHIVSCGRISPEKGMDLAVEACAALVAAGHTRLHWWLVGGGPAEAQVRERIRQLHMESHVTLLGMRKNPYPYIGRADLYVQPSRVEAFGLTILEAQILGRPVVSTDTAGAAELLRDGENGLLCPIDSQQLAQTVERLLTQREQLHRLRQAAQNMDFAQRNRQNVALLETLL